MTLEETIKKYEDFAKSFQDTPRSADAREARQIAGWLQELKERREKDLRAGTDF